MLRREAAERKEANLTPSQKEEAAQKDKVMAAIAGEAINEGLATSAAHFNPATDDVASPTPGLNKI